MYIHTYIYTKIKFSILKYNEHIKYMTKLYELYIIHIAVISICVFLKTNQYQGKK